jgi:hypothetical protein
MNLVIYDATITRYILGLLMFLSSIIRMVTKYGDYSQNDNYTPLLSLSDHKKLVDFEIEE